MKRSGHIPWGEYRLGLVVFIGLLIFVYASVRGGAAFFENREELHARFPDVAGLTDGSPVWFRGVEVGSVSGLEITSENDTSFIEVRFKVRNEILPQLNRDATVEIAAINFFGEKFLDLRPGTPGSGDLDPSQPLPSTVPPELLEMLAESEGLLEKLEIMADDLAVITRNIREGNGSLGALVNDRGFHDDLQRMVRETTTLARSLDEGQHEMVAALTQTAGHLDTLMIAFNSSEGTIGRLLRDDSLYESVAGAAQSADSTMTRVASGHGTAGKLTTDEAMYVEMTETLKKLNILLEDLQKNPKKYFKVSVF